MTRKHPPHEDPAFLRDQEWREALTVTRTIQASPEGHFVDLVDGESRLLLRVDWDTNVNALGFAHPASDAPIVCAEREDARARRERELLRAQLANEARDCWRAFFQHWAPTNTALLVGMEYAPEINWHFADKAREFDAAAARIVV